MQLEAAGFARRLSGHCAMLSAFECQVTEHYPPNMVVLAAPIW